MTSHICIQDLSIFQYGCLDLVNNIMHLLDSTWPKVMMLSGLVRFQVKLTLELFCNTGGFWCDQEEPLSSIGIVWAADVSRMNECWALWLASSVQPTPQRHLHQNHLRTTMASLLQAYRRNQLPPTLRALRKHCECGDRPALLCKILIWIPCRMATTRSTKASWNQPWRMPFQLRRPSLRWFAVNAKEKNNLSCTDLC